MGQSHFDVFWVTQAFEVRDDVFQFAPQAHFQHRSVRQITKNGRIAMSFAHGKFVDPQETGRGQGLLLFLLQSPLAEGWANQAAETVADKARTNLKALGNLRHRLREGLLSDGFAQAHGRSPASATRHVWFSKGSLTLTAAEAAFEDDQFHLILPQADISLRALPAIMDVRTPLLTMRTRRMVLFGHHFHAQASIFMLFLRHQAKFRQAQGDHDSFLTGSLFDVFFGMLGEQGLFLLILRVGFFPSSTIHKPFRLLFGRVLLRNKLINPPKGQRVNKNVLRSIPQRNVKTSSVLLRVGHR